MVTLSTVSDPRLIPAVTPAPSPKQEDYWPQLIISSASHLHPLPSLDHPVTRQNFCKPDVLGDIQTMCPPLKERYHLILPANFSQC